MIPTRKREVRLAFALEALAAQTIADRIEVVVVRDGSWDGPRATPPAGLDVRFVDLERRLGPAVARNVGWRWGSAPVVAFTDDDCRPERRWAEALAAAVQGDVFVQGRTEPDPDERHLLGGLSRSQSITEPNEVFQTCNVAYPRELLERLGGFDDTHDYGDDIDLGWRAQDAGAVPVWAADALVWHCVHTRHLPAALLDTWRWRHIPALVARHPDRRRLLRHGIFWKEAHARILLAAAGGLAARRLATAPSRPAAAPSRRAARAAAALALAAGAAAPYLALHARTYDRSPRGFARAVLELPSRAAVDAAETLVTIGGAIHHRTPMA